MRNKAFSALVVVLLLLPITAFAAGDDGGHRVIFNIALCMVAASVLGIFVKALRQPLILGHILAGVLIGPIGIGLIKDHHEIITIAEIGLILLLFMIGLEIDLKKMLASGKLVIIPGLLQFPITLGLGYLILGLLENVGLTFGAGTFARLYVAVAISISSTMIVVKLLYEKFELDTLPGRITLGILVFQDIWAIIVLAIQPNLADPNVVSLLRTFGSGGVLVLGALLLSRFVLPIVFKSAAKLPELMLILSLGWCFLVSLVASIPAVGLSMEMGALIAGVALATFPYNMDVNAKILSLRDFFITLFFVALGMQIPIPQWSMIVKALVIVALVLVLRGVGIFGVLSVLRPGHRIAVLPSLNLSQISEFSLVIVSLGIVYGHVQGETLSQVIWVFSILAVFSTYFILYNHNLQNFISRTLRAIGWNDLTKIEEEEKAEEHYPIVILGFFRTASAFLEDVKQNRPELLEKIKVIDFNPVVKQHLDKIGVANVYGDIGDINTLHHAEIEEAEVVLSTIPDPILKGVSNEKFIHIVQELAPGAKIFVTSERPSQTLKLYQVGADYVIQPSKMAGTSVYYAVDNALRGDLEALKEKEINFVSKRQEVLS
ncbi:sodium:proton exchanger [bacterium]|nr:sodium:proton exchanger [bacterium]